MGGKESKARSDSLSPSSSAGALRKGRSGTTGFKSSIRFDNLVEWIFVYECLGEHEEEEMEEHPWNQEVVRLCAQSRRYRVTDRGKWGTIMDDIAAWLRPEVRATWSDLAERVDPLHRQVLLKGVADYLSADRDVCISSMVVTPRPDLEPYEPYVVSPLLSTARASLASVAAAATGAVLGDEFTLKAGDTKFCTGDFESAHVLLFSDEGGGEITIYPFETADQASLATKDWWNTRITYCLTQDGKLSEVDWAGPELYRTIRQAAACIPWNV